MTPDPHESLPVEESSPVSLFEQINWQAIAAANHSRVISLTRDTVVMSTTHFGELRLTEVQPGVLQLHTTDLPRITLVPGFRSAGYTSRHLISYLDGGQLLPTDVLSDRILCVLRGDPLGSQEWRPTGLREAPERLLELKEGSIIETIREWWFSPEDEEPVFRKGDRLRIEYIILGRYEFSDLSALSPEELADVDWAKDGVQATFLESGHSPGSIDMLFSDFNLVNTAEEEPPQS